MLDRAWISAHVPHRDAMCLLDRVESWDADHVRCTTGSHRDPANPLRAHGRLGAASGIEYAAQAMAVHGALCADGEAAANTTAGSAAAGSTAAGSTAAGSTAADVAAADFTVAAGMLASARGVDVLVARLDDIAGDLTVIATRQAADARAIAYAFEIRAGDRQLLSGRATVLLVQPPAPLAIE